LSSFAYAICEPKPVINQFPEQRLSPRESWYRLRTLLNVSRPTIPLIAEGAVAGYCLK